MIDRGKVLLFFALLAAMVGCTRDEPKERVAPREMTRISIAGSSAMLPLVAEAANRYMRMHPTVAIEVSAGGSRLGLERALKGEIAIGTSDIFADGPNAAALEDHKVAVTGFAAMANRGSYNEQIDSLTLAQLKGIFSGAITNWSKVGGQDQTIVVINRPKGSGTRITFGDIVLGGDHFVPGEEEESSALVQTALEQTAGAISYLALGYRRDTLKCFAINGVSPTSASIERGDYPVWSFEHMYTLGPAQGPVKEFIDFMLSPAVQQELVPKARFTAVARMRSLTSPGRAQR